MIYSGTRKIGWHKTRDPHRPDSVSQISNFLTGVGSPGSEWSEKVKKLSIQPCLASESSKPFSKKALFFDIVQQI